MHRDASRVIVGCSCLCLCLGVTTSRGHELTFAGKLFLPADVVDVCIGNLNGADADSIERVDEEDVLLLVDAFGQSCSEEYGCLEDWNHNHYVGDGDLRVLLANWGVCRYRADVTGDGDVDLDDATEVAANQGLDCRPDLDWNGTVQGNDFNLAQLAWGPGNDHQGDVDRDDSLEIGDDLLAVFDALGRDCFADVDLDGFVDCDDLELVCDNSDADCCDLYVGICPELECPS